MEIREKIALYQKLLSDPKLTETQRDVIAKLLAEENQKANSAKSHSRCGYSGASTRFKHSARLIHRQITDA
jgi:hypothetical protein